MKIKRVFAYIIDYAIVCLISAFLILIPALKKMHIGQKISVFVGESHRKKEGTPTMGGLIFIIPTIITTIFLLLTNKIEFSVNSLKWSIGRFSSKSSITLSIFLL